MAIRIRRSSWTWIYKFAGVAQSHADMGATPMMDKRAVRFGGEKDRGQDFTLRLGFQHRQSDVIMGSSVISNFNGPLKNGNGPRFQNLTQRAQKVLLDPLQVLVGPVTRARAKSFKEALNGLMCGFWSQVQDSYVQDGLSLNPTWTQVIQVKDECSSGLELSI
ncbi:hypothetical protein J1N35_039863 [Gossypium stocksii]|uniref:Uncharacterized protein n=1 Tax=Gossypium stocksii TaxID=47602 RepID=A0A9D3UCR4_9ROSI|nr:hypothetical protein J1N35_039863 [Gossypium stocksii]